MESSRVYEEDDKVDEKLLNQLKGWIMYNRLGDLARHLGFTYAEISRIMELKNPEEQIFKVIFIFFNFRSYIFHYFYILHSSLLSLHLSFFLVLRFSFLFLSFFRFMYGLLQSYTCLLSLLLSLKNQVMGSKPLLLTELEFDGDSANLLQITS